MSFELTARKQPTQARAKATVDAILQAAAQVLVEEGYDKASTNRVAKVAGVSVGSLYQYFPNKDAMFLALTERHMDEMLQLLVDTVERLLTAPIPEAVRTYIDAINRAHQHEPELHRELTALMPRLAEISEIADISCRAQQPVRLWLEAHKDEIRVKDLDTATYVLVTTVEMTVHRALFDRPDLIQSGALAEQLTDMVLGYLLPSGR